MKCIFWQIEFKNCSSSLNGYIMFMTLCYYLIAYCHFSSNSQLRQTRIWVFPLTLSSNTYYFLPIDRAVTLTLNATPTPTPTLTTLVPRVSRVLEQCIHDLVVKHCSRRESWLALCGSFVSRRRGSGSLLWRGVHFLVNGQGARAWGVVVRPGVQIRGVWGRALWASATRAGDIKSLGFIGILFKVQKIKSKNK